jgi:hypothetical protein
LETDRGRTATFVSIKLPIREFNDHFLELKIGFHDDKFDCELWEMDRDCSIFLQGRFVFSDFPCWDSDSEEKRFFDEYRQMKTYDPHSFVIMRKDNPTLEERLPQDLTTKVNIRNMKNTVFKHFPPSSVVYQVMAQEKDEQLSLEVDFKLPLWFNLIDICAREKDRTF